MQPDPEEREAAFAAELEVVLAGGVRIDYQPIVELRTRSVVGYEALARGPIGSSLEFPNELFSAAHLRGRTGQLEGAAWTAAFRGALQGGVDRQTALFVNFEPEAMGTELDTAVGKTLRDVRRRLNVFFEVTERALTDRPAQLLDSVAQMRARGFGIALDDVGADRRSLALLPLLRPDVVKLDASLIHSHPSAHSGEVMNGVCAYAEQAGAVILAEGIENEAHLLAALSMGATLGQGWLFGHPGPLPASHATGTALGVRTVPVRPSRDPVELVHARRSLEIGRKDVLLSVTRALEAQALERAEHTVVAATFQDIRNFTPATRRRYERLGAHTSLCVVLGVDMPDPPVVGVRGAALAPDDPLSEEWDVVVLGPHYASALVARDLGDTGPDHERRFEFVLTFDRELVIDVAAALISRIASPRLSIPPV